MEKDFTQRIDAYLDKELSSKEIASFEADLQVDKDLAAAFKVHKAEREAVLLMLKQDYKSQIKEWRSNASDEEEVEPAKVVAMPKKEPARVRPLRRILSIAASILVLFTAGSIFWGSTNYSNNALGEKWYMNADTGGDKGSAASIDASYNEGVNAYFNDKNHQKAITEFSKVNPQSASYIDAQYYLAHANYANENYLMAIKHYNTVLQAAELPAYINKDKIRWNRLMAMLENNQLDDNFYKELDTIAQGGQVPFNQKAADLKKQLGSFWRNLAF